MRTQEEMATYEDYANNGSMSEMTGEARWRQIFESQAERLLADLQESPDGPIWQQDLYDRHLKYLQCMDTQPTWSRFCADGIG